MSTRQQVLKFKGCTHFRQRLVCSILSGKSIKITEIRANLESPGLQDYEASFLRLIDKVTNGTVVEINETGTEVYFRPGVLIGGTLQHSCPTTRSISYFIEGLLPISPFCKNPLSVTFTGITNSTEDQSVDIIRTVTIPLVEKFGVPGLEVKILKRGMPPQGGGLVIFNSGIVKELSAIQLVEEGKIKRIRGIAYCARVSPQFANRMVDACKASLKEFTHNIYVNTDHYKGQEAGLSPGFGVCLVAETTTGALISAEAISEGGSRAEDIGESASNYLLEEILRGGYVDSVNQSMMFLFMTLCPQDVSKIRIGKLTDYSIEYLRILRDFFGMKFKIVSDIDTDTLTLSCVGIGYTNISKKAQ